MPALPSFINYKSGRKTKKSPFSLLRGEPSTSSATASPPRNYVTTEVIDIHDQAVRYSLDFDGGKPIDVYENPIVDQDTPYPAGASSPQVQLDIEFSPPLTDWFPADLLQSEGFNGATAGLKASGSGLRNEVANLTAMNPSHFGKLPGYSNFNRLEQPSTSSQKNTPNSISITPNRRPTSPVSPSFKLNQRISLHDTPTSSAVSGTTLARALLSNSFILTDNRSSKYRSGMVGLTRSDSTTLPRSEHSFGAAYTDDRFSIGPDAPPIPFNASWLYEPPKKPRTAAAELREKRKQNLRRRSSTGSIAARILPETPTPSTRPSSALLSPGMEFDMASLMPSPEPRKPPPLPRSPLPPTPKLAYLQEDENGSKRESGPQEVTQNYPVDSQLLSPDLDTLSPTFSFEDPHSAKNLEDVLNYYSLPDSPEPLLTNASYRPAFSPISEESSSQLSPPTPYRNEQRESQRNMPIGARSPLSGSPRVRGESVLLPRRPSDGRHSRQQLHPLGERPNSVTQLSSSSSPPSSSSFASVGSDLLAPLAPPQLSTIFNRQRSGSAPSPIRAVRDSRDANAYNITVTSRLSNPTTPSTDGDVDNGGNVVAQDFPETPDMFSPTFTGGASGSSSMGQQSMEGPGGLDVVAPMPTTPMSATVSRVTSQPSLAQQILLNRAGTTVRHSRQASISKIKTNGMMPRSGSPSNRKLLDISDIDSTANAVNVEAASSSSTTLIVSQDPVPELSVTSVEHAPVEDVVPRSPDELTAGSSIKSGMSAADLTRSPSRGTIMTQGSDGSSMYTSSSERKMKSLPSIPISPSPSTSGSLGSASGSPIPPVVGASSATPASTLVSLPGILASTNATPNIPPPPTIPPPSPTESQKIRALPLRSRPPPTLTIASSVAASTVAVNGNPSGENSPASLRASTRSSVADGNPNDHPNVSQNTNVIAPEQSSSLTYNNDKFTGRASDIFRGTSLGSPPPYYTVVSEAIAQTEQNAINQTNHTLPFNPRTPQANDAATLESFQFSGPRTGNAVSTTPGPSQLEWSQSSDFRPPSLLARESSTMSQRSRMRPPLPAGPRRPSQASTIGSSSGLFAYQRDRAGSMSSVNSNPLIQIARRGREAEPMPSPQFQTPSPKWRGYTMEIAKWTFTSAQLQAIVSKAIQQSAQASSIRLLRLEVLENELPEEMRRLEVQRTELKTRYKMLTRRRTTVVDALSAHMSEWDGENPTSALRLLDNLKEIAASLDQVAEELHSVDGQWRIWTR
ncbi:hypothetical protein M413DRAFT_151591 [Hebeloma cylindrosporum]|uniref:Uncharacterized protein n=1 Tax=Hebeloma cylindrosporum TaxID=76867 RepID=A0A0C2XVE2_HEBCY|nr:hypothetical protein M413DRAFT_151591 [Hebeloma cylindrosporum h7]